MYLVSLKTLTLVLTYTYMYACQSAEERCSLDFELLVHVHVSVCTIRSGQIQTPLAYLNK